MAKLTEWLRQAFAALLPCPRKNLAGASRKATVKHRSSLAAFTRPHLANIITISYRQETGWENILVLYWFSTRPFQRRQDQRFLPFKHSHQYWACNSQSLSIILKLCQQVHAYPYYHYSKASNLHHSYTWNIVLINKHTIHSLTPQSPHDQNFSSESAS